MTAILVHGDHISCSRVGGGMRSESSRLRQHAQLLDDAVTLLAGWEGPDAAAARTSCVASLGVLRAAADLLDRKSVV